MVGVGAGDRAALIVPKDRSAEHPRQRVRAKYLCQVYAELGAETQVQCLIGHRWCIAQLRVGGRKREQRGAQHEPAASVEKAIVSAEGCQRSWRKIMTLLINQQVAAERRPDAGLQDQLP